MSVLRALVVGLGNMGRHHARVWRGIPGVELAGVCDSDGSRAERGQGAPFFTDLTEAIDRIRPDLVTVAVPTPWHASVARQALEGGANVLVEKPIAATVAEARELAEVARAMDRVLCVGHIEHFNPAVEHLKQAIDSGRIGHLSSLVARRVGGFPTQLPSTDVALDLAVHDIGVMAMLSGVTPTLLAAHGSTTIHPSAADSVEILLTLGPASGFVQANWVSPVKLRSIAVTGSSGYAEANYISQEISFYEADPPEAQEDFEAFVQRFGRPRRTHVTLPGDEPLRRELAAFADAARGVNANIVTPDLAIAILDVAVEASDAIARSLAAVSQ